MTRPIFFLIGFLILCFMLGALFYKIVQKFTSEYGDNSRVGRYADINGIKMYYEIYGRGKPLVLIHGNEQCISNMEYQIKYFSRDYRVVAADSRGHGKSGFGQGELTYAQMADDWSCLLDSLKIDSAYVLGWSDGGIIGLLLAIHHPGKVGKLAAMGTNLQPDTSAVYYWAVDWIKEQARIIEDKIAENDKSKNWRAKKQYMGLLGKQPNIALTDLHKISCPVIILAGDKDVIREEHTILIYQNLAKAHLCIFPGATHMIPVEDPDLFNQTVHQFFKNPFQRPDTKDDFQ